MRAAALERGCSAMRSQSLISCWGFQLAGNRLEILPPSF